MLERWRTAASQAFGSVSEVFRVMLASLHKFAAMVRLLMAAETPTGQQWSSADLHSYGRDLLVRAAAESAQFASS